MKRFKYAIIFVAAIWPNLSLVLAHEREMEVTNLAEAEWFGPFLALIIISGSIFIARTIRRRRTLINQN